MASRRGCIPLFLKAEPHSTGVISRERVFSRSRDRISWGEISSSLRYFSAR